MRFASLAPLALVLTLACPAPSEDGETDETGSETASDTAEESTTDTGECMPAGVFADCVQGELSSCNADGQPALCLADSIEDPSIGVCSRRCESECDCWAAPVTGNAAIACVALVDGDPKKSCVLDCGAGQTCPDGMACLETLQICVWPKE